MAKLAGLLAIAAVAMWAAVNVDVFYTVREQSQEVEEQAESDEPPANQEAEPSEERER